jgi:predicted phage tail protein
MPRRPKITQLPPELRAQLEKLLADQSHGGYEALSAWLAEQGYQIGKSSLAAIRASTEAAKIIAQASPDEADEHSAAVIRLVQSALFDAMLAVREAEDADPAEQVKLLTHAARAVAEASRASIGQKRWAEEVRAKLDAVERAAARDGKTLDAATLEAIKRGLYGG